ncbi:hypothetical protein HDU89_007172 [Geranomyces variabilis]|nr:hypothetical protein HDU89_007172 [Geranomyces variabilis]
MAATRLHEDLYLTYTGTLRVVATSRNANARPFFDWAVRVVQIVHIGNNEDRVILAASLSRVDIRVAEQIFNGCYPAPSGVYIISLGCLKDLRDSLTIENAGRDDDVVVKLGRTKDCAKRMSDHMTDYGAIRGAQPTFIAQISVDPFKLVRCETMVKRFFAQKGWMLMSSGHEVLKNGETREHNREELAVIPKAQLRLAKDEYQNLAKDFGGGYGEVLAKNAELEQALQNQAEVHALQLAGERLQREAGECLHEHQLGSLQPEGALKDEITIRKLAAAAPTPVRSSSKRARKSMLLRAGSKSLSARISIWVLWQTVRQCSRPHVNCQGVCVCGPLPDHSAALRREYARGGFNDAATRDLIIFVRPAKQRSPQHRPAASWTQELVRDISSDDLLRLDCGDGRSLCVAGDYLANYVRSELKSGKLLTTIVLKGTDPDGRELSLRLTSEIWLRQLNEPMWRQSLNAVLGRRETARGLIFLYLDSLPKPDVFFWAGSVDEAGRRNRINTAQRAAAFVSPVYFPTVDPRKQIRIMATTSGFTKQMFEDHQSGGACTDHAGWKEAYRNFCHYWAWLDDEARASLGEATDDVKFPFWKS